MTAEQEAKLAAQAAAQMDAMRRALEAANRAGVTGNAKTEQIAREVEKATEKK